MCSPEEAVTWGKRRWNSGGFLDRRPAGWMSQLKQRRGNAVLSLLLLSLLRSTMICYSTSSIISTEYGTVITGLPAGTSRATRDPVWQRANRGTLPGGNAGVSVFQLTVRST